LTTALTPNTEVYLPGKPTAYDVVTNADDSGFTVYAVLTADSYHPAGADCLFGDGSVKFMKNSINGVIWRALGTIAGGEVISSDSY
jgi:prepilin-type processing-associated H-X9-DG protein